MANDLTLPEGTFGRAALPAHLRAAFEGKTTQILTERIQGSSLGIKGKVFTINDEGASTPLLRTDPDTGDEVPLSSLPVVVLDYARKQGRSYFEGAYVDGESKAPTCYSLDSVIPEPDVETKQAPKCALCPLSVKGSRGDGTNSPACQPNRVLAVIPIRGIEKLPPLRLKLAQTSLYDGQSPDARVKGNYAFDNYLDSLKAKGIPAVHTVVTNLSFDSSKAYPKLFFRASRWVSDEELPIIEKLRRSSKVDDILAWTSLIALEEGRGTREATPATPAALVQYAPTKAAEPEDGFVAAAQHPADAALERAGAKNPQLNKGPAGFVAPPQEDGEDEDDYAMRVAQTRKAWKAAEAEKAARAQALADAAAKARTEAKPAAPAAAAFVPPAQQDGEDEDDYNIRVAQARKAHRLAEAAALAPKPEPKPFVAPTQEDGEDEDDYAIRVAQAKKAWKAGGITAEQVVKGTGPAATAAKVEAKPAAAAAEPAPRRRRSKAEMDAARAAEAAPTAPAKAEPFLPEEAAKAAKVADLGEDDGGDFAMPETAAAPAAAAAPAKAKPAPIAATPVEVPAEFASMLEVWGDE